MRTTSTTVGRRRASRLVVLLATAALLAACGTPAEEPGAPEPDTEDPGTEEPDAEDPDAEDPDAEGPDEEDPDAEDPDTDDQDGTAGPTPDPAAMDDPCAEHEGREGDAFIDVVSPVQDQVVSGSVELVGCSNVFEATVAYELYDGDGVLLDSGFTTAECGTGCVGAFRDTVSLAAAEGEPVALLQVFSENMADEGERQLSLVEVQLVLE